MTTTDPSPTTPSPDSPGLLRRYWNKLSKHLEFGTHLPLLIVHAKSPLGLCIILLVVVAMGGGIWYAARAKPQPASIVVFAPDWRKAADGSFYQDGVVQKRGFDKAELECEGVPNRLRVEYAPMNESDSAEVLLQEMKQFHARGAVFFVMTMSTKIESVRNGFIQWRSECSREGTRLPVLVTTVASAPNLADAANGIVRWYVRSEEESELVAEYLRWKKGIEHVCIFYITRTPGQSDNGYGRCGMEVFRDRFGALKPRELHEPLDIEGHGVTADTAATEVTTFVRQYRSNGNQKTRSVAVFVVGYGNMVSATVNALISQEFDGPIVCTSTLTEPEWQPIDQSADNRIFTVLPRAQTSRQALEGNDRNVVFFFSKETLRRVLEWTAADPNPDSFLNRWVHGKDSKRLSEEYLANGDIVVRLDIVDAERWR